MDIGRRGRSNAQPQPPIKHVTKTAHSSRGLSSCQLGIHSHFAPKSGIADNSPAGRGPRWRIKIEWLYQKLGPLPTRPISALASR